MANLLWGRVYYQKHFAGILCEEPGGATSFAYDESYWSAKLPPIAYTLPLRPEPFITPSGLHPFFDNLVAEGWLEEAQTRLLGKRQATRLELLLAFGQDCIGAVSIVDPELVSLTEKWIDKTNVKEIAVMMSRASLSGVQPKLTLIEKEKGIFYPAKMGEISTHIAKFASNHHEDLVINEYLCTLALQALLPNDTVVEFSRGQIQGFSEPALIIKRFDRDDKGQRLHFEEFNQLLGKISILKYEGSYKNMADFIAGNDQCLRAQIYFLYLRILAGILLGNTDMHLKNFALFHTDSGFRLTPSYDTVAAVLYDYKTVALVMSGIRDLQWGNIKYNHIIKLGEEFGLSKTVIKMAYEQLKANKEAAAAAIASADWGTDTLKELLINLMEKRWNGTFAFIGQPLLKKP